MLKIFVEGKELGKYPITADENYSSHKGIYGLASMGNPIQYPLDFGTPVYLDLSTNMDGTVIQRGSTLGNFIAVDYGEYQVCYVHVYLHEKWIKGTKIKAGTVFAAIAPTGVNGGFAPHLHIYATKGYKTFKVRELIFPPVVTPPPVDPCASVKTQLEASYVENESLSKRLGEFQLKIDSLESAVTISQGITTEATKALDEAQRQEVELRATIEKQTSEIATLNSLVEGFKIEVERLKKLSVENLTLSDFIVWVGLKLGIKKSE